MKVNIKTKSKKYYICFLDENHKLYNKQIKQYRNNLKLYIDDINIKFVLIITKHKTNIKISKMLLNHETGIANQILTDVSMNMSINDYLSYIYDGIII